MYIKRKYIHGKVIKRQIMPKCTTKYNGCKVNPEEEKIHMNVQLKSVLYSQWMKVKVKEEEKMRREMPN